MKRDEEELTHIGSTIGEVLKEVCRRAELRQRLEAQHGRGLSDEGFLALAEQTGMSL